jgi:hypothetical protein
MGAVRKYGVAPTLNIVSLNFCLIRETTIMQVLFKIFV